MASGSPPKTWKPSWPRSAARATTARFSMSPHPVPLFRGQATIEDGPFLFPFPFTPESTGFGGVLGKLGTTVLPVFLGELAFFDPYGALGMRSKSASDRRALAPVGHRHVGEPSRPQALRQ